MSDASSQSGQTEPVKRVLSLEDVGTAADLDALACNAVALEMLQAAAGDTHALASFTLNLGSPHGEGECSAEAWVDRRTRTLTFCQMRVTAGGELLFAARGLFSRRV